MPQRDVPTSPRATCLAHTAPHLPVLFQVSALVILSSLRVLADSPTPHSRLAREQHPSYTPDTDRRGPTMLRAIRAALAARHAVNVEAEAIVANHDHAGLRQAMDAGL